MSRPPLFTFAPFSAILAPKKNEVGKVRSQSGKVSQKGKTESRSSYGGIAIMLVIFLIYVIIKVVGN